MRRTPNGPMYALPIEISLSEDGEAKEGQLLRVGEFDHPTYGTVNITPENLLAFKANFEANVLRTKLPINYDHEKTKAAAWIEALDIRNGGRELWARLAWTPLGQTRVREGEYRYLSAEIDWTWKDPESKKVVPCVLRGAALTNYPFIKGMAPLEATEPETPKGKEAMNLKEITDALREHGVDFAEVQRKAGDHDRLAKQVVELTESNKAISAKVEKAEAEKVELSERVKKLEGEQAELKFKDLVERGMREGKLTKAFAETKFKEVFEKMGAEFAEGFLKDLPKVVTTEAQGTAAEPQKAGDKSAAVELSEKAEKLSKDEKIEFCEAVKRVRRENPKLAEAYDAQFKA